MVKVDKEKCIGCGLCSSICSDVFEMDDEGKAQVKANADMEKECVKKAEKQCPVEAISL